MKRFLGLIIGIVFIIVGVSLYIRNDRLVKNCTEEVEATVVDMKQELSTDDNGLNYMYYPIIEYVVDGNTIRATMDSGSSTPKYDLNEKITILYNPNKVKEFIVKGDKTLNMFTIIFTALGILITGYGFKMALTKE